MLIQALVNILIIGSLYTLVGISFGLIFMPTGFFHFAHGAIYTLGAYMTLAAFVWLGFPLPIAALFGVLFCGLVGLTIDSLIYRKFRRRKASPLILLLASLGLYIVIQNLISLSFGDYIQSFRIGPVKESLNIFGARISVVQILILVTNLLLTVLITVILARTKVGKTIRAVANDPILASVSGINTDRVISLSCILGSVIAGCAGILFALDYDITPTMGLNVLMMGIIAVIIGGINSIPGIALGAFLLALAQNFGALVIGSKWQDAIAFLVLIIFLLFKPEGFFGKKVKSATV